MRDRPTARSHESLPVLVVGRAQRVAAALPASPPAISADGRYVAFVSESGDLVPGDRNVAADVFVRDTVENRTVLVSRSRFGGSAAGCSLQPSISADGQVVAFTSSASDLVPGDGNGTLDVFVHDLRTGRTELVSRDSGGAPADNDSFSPALSADGRFVAFSSLADNLDSRDHNHAPDVYLHDRVTRRTSLISTGSDGRAADGPSGQPSVSGDGRMVAFTSAATNLDPDDTNGVADVYLHDVVTGSTELVSRGLDGGAAHGLSSEPAISADGRSVAFTSSAADLVPNDGNGADDVFVRSSDGSEVRLVSTSADGVAATGGSHSPSISADGHRVTFLSAGADLGPGEPAADQQRRRDSAYLRDLDGAGTALVSYASGRVPGDGETTAAVISGSGAQVAFSDTSGDLAGQEEAAGELHVYVAPVTTVAIPGSVTPVTPGRHRSH
jgi:Tol biopolymer transport system component